MASLMVRDSFNAVQREGEVRSSNLEGVQVNDKCSNLER